MSEAGVLQKKYSESDLKMESYYTLHTIPKGSFLSLDPSCFQYSFLTFSLKTIFIAWLPGWILAGCEPALTGYYSGRRVVIFPWDVLCWRASQPLGIQHELAHALQDTFSCGPACPSPPSPQLLPKYPSRYPNIPVFNFWLHSSIFSHAFVFPLSMPCSPSPKPSGSSLSSPCNSHWDQMLLPVCLSDTSRVETNEITGESSFFWWHCQRSLWKVGGTATIRHIRNMFCNMNTTLQCHP